MAGGFRYITIPLSLHLFLANFLWFMFDAITFPLLMFMFFKCSSSAFVAFLVSGRLIYTSLLTISFPLQLHVVIHRDTMCDEDAFNNLPYWDSLRLPRHIFFNDISLCCVGKCSCKSCIPPQLSVAIKSIFYNKFSNSLRVEVYRIHAFVTSVSVCLQCLVF